MNIKNIICGMVGVAGAAVSNLFGGWSAALTTLLILMMIDYITGFLIAAVWKKSKKTTSGGLQSLAGWKGLIRKGVTLLIVLVAYRLDLALHTVYVKDAVIIAFSTNECISLIENAGLMGIPIPSILLKAIDILKGNDGDGNDD